MVRIEANFQPTILGIIAVPETDVEQAQTLKKLVIEKVYSQLLTTKSTSLPKRFAAYNSSFAESKKYKQVRKLSF